MLRLWFVLLFSFFIATQAVAQEKLIFAIDMIRHGDRTPTADIPKAPHDWKEGLGQLTATGMQQEYQLGTRLRKMYIDTYHLLPARYSVGTIYVRSSDVDRTLMSAQAFLMGLYPLGTGPILLNSKKPALPQAFQPISVHTVAKDQETLLIAWTESPKFKEYLKEYVYPTAEWKQKTAELQPKFAAWSEATGIHITDLYQLKSLGDTLMIDQLHHVPLPKDLTDKDAKEIIEAGHWVFTTAFGSPEMGKITGNALLKMVAEYFQQVVEGKTTLKYVLISSHDSTQLSLMSIMSVPLKNAPPYASDLNFSLFDAGQQHYFVKIKFNDKPVLLPGCDGEVCSLEKFNELVKRVGA